MTNGSTAPSQPTAPPADNAPSLAQVSFVFGGTLVALGVAAGERALVLGGAAAAFVVLAITRFEIFVLGALVIRAALDSSKTGGPLEPTTALGAAVLVFVLVREVLDRAAGAGPRPIRAPFRLPLQAFLAAAVLSSLGSADVAASLTETLRLAGLVAMVIALERTLSSPGAVKRVLIAVFASAVIPIVVALIQLATGSGRLIGGFSRISGTFLHPNPFSIYLAMLIVLAVALLPHVRGPARASLLLGGAVATVLLLLTYTRGSWIALVVGLVVVGAIQSRTLLVGVIVGCLAVALLVPSVSARFSDLETTARYSGAPANSLVWRVTYWNDVIDLADESPLTGIGLTGIARSTAEAKNAHNDLVRVYVETGVLGLASYLALGWSLVRTARRALRATATRPGWRSGTAVGFAGVLAVLGVVSVSSNVITQVVLLWYAVAIAMLAVAVTTGFEHEREALEEVGARGDL